MKKLFTLLTAILVLFSVTAIKSEEVYAEAPAGMFLLYVNIPDDWEEPHIWAWDDAGNGAFSSWPGGEAEADTGNPGWYYCYLPNWAINIIVNANDGGIQTSGDLKSEGGNLWISVTSSDEAVISYDQQTAGEAPEYIEKITVSAKIPASWSEPNLWAWLDPEGTNAFSSWPGGAMKATNDEWYSIKAPSFINSIIINGNNGDVQTSDIKDLEQGKDIWVVVADDNTAAFYYENPDLMVPNITVRAQVPTDWENPCLWAWSHPDGTNVFSSWPGEPLSLNGSWYEIEVPGWINSLIVNASGGSVQTSDISELETGKDIWVVVNADGSFVYDYVEIATETEIELVAEEQQPAVTAEPEPKIAEVVEAPSANDSNSTLWIIICLIAIAVIAALIVIYMKKKK